LSPTTDFHFLTAFSRAYALAADAAAASGDEEACVILRELQESVDDELGLHRNFAAAWGVVLEDDASSVPRPSAATSDYTSFLLETASEASRRDSLACVSRALAAMVPCCRLYGWLGVKLAHETAERAEKAAEKTAVTAVETAAKEKKEKNNPFRPWIETYSSAAYHAATVKLETLLDRLAEGLSAEERGAFFLLEFFFSWSLFCALGRKRFFRATLLGSKRCARCRLL
jgi:thiaminase/transcriptional activator TenA